jgi:predicted nuclease of predicted toxin-antitoxin system
MTSLLANENFPYSSILILREKGFNVLAVCENHSGISDHEVMEMASEEKRTIVTFDRDYGELVFKYGHRPKQGIIYFRWKEFYPKQPGEFLIQLFAQSNIRIEQSFTVIDKDNIRQRKY